MTTTEKITFTENEDITTIKSKIRKDSYQVMIKNDDGTYNIIHPKNRKPEVSESINDVNFQLLIISEVLQTRKHIGIYNDEAKRENISVVKAKPIVFEEIKVAK